MCNVPEDMDGTVIQEKAATWKVVGCSALDSDKASNSHHLSQQGLLTCHEHHNRQEEGLLTCHEHRRQEESTDDVCHCMVECSVQPWLMKKEIKLF